MNDYDLMRDLARLTLFIIIMIALSCTCACKSVEYRDCVSTRVDTCYISSIQYDSIVKYDSVRVYEKGCTLLVDRWRYVENKSGRVDTCWRYKVMADTLVITEVKEVSKTPWWKDALIYLLTFVIFMLIILFIVKAIKRS